jgi:DUF1680 family protein
MSAAQCRNPHGLVLALGFWAASIGRADDLAARYRLTLNRVLQGAPPRYTADFLLADAVPRHVRRFTQFSGDVSGRCIEALACVERLEGQRYALLDELLNAVPKLQKPDGYFGDDFPDGPIRPFPHMALLWGNGRMLIGLVEAYRTRRDPTALATARKLGDFIVSIAPRLDRDDVMKEFSGDQHAVGYICWTQIIEGLVGLYELTRDARYLEVGRGMARRTFLHAGQHSHGFLTSVRGMVQLAAVTGEREWLDRAAGLWKEVITSGNLLQHGCVPEAFKPTILRDEGCSEADWLRLSLALWHALEDPAYLDAAEHAWFNEFAMNQFSTGDFGHRTITPEGMGGAIPRMSRAAATGAFSAVSVAAGCARAWWCCTFHGLRAFPDVLASVFHVRGDAIHYNLPLSGIVATNGVTLRARSSLERDASCRLEVLSSDGAPRTLVVRQPPWAEPIELTVRSGVDVQRVQGLQVRRAWQRGDVLEIRYPLRTRVLRHPDRTNAVAFAVGPWILGVEPSGSPAFFDEPRGQNRVRVGSLEAAELLPPPMTEALRFSRFAVPVAHRGLPLIPGGYPVQPQVVWLRPIAEQTGIRDDTEWVFWFVPANP